jgi:hypothetical protein
LAHRRSNQAQRLLRKAAARNAEALVAATGELLGTYTGHECANYLPTPATGKPKFIPRNAV